FRPRFFQGMEAGTDNAVPLTLCMLLFFMAAPLTASEMLASAERLRRNLGDQKYTARDRWPPSPLLAGLLGLIALVPMLTLADSIQGHPPILLVGLSAGSFGLGVVLVWSLVRILTRL